MAKASKKDLVQALLDRYDHKTFSDELKIHTSKNNPSSLFQLLCFSLLASTRIGGDIAMSAMRALKKRGWTTPQKMGASTWRERVITLNESGYARYDESTAARLGENVELLQDKYDGDLRKLRDAAGQDPKQERKLLKEFKNVGDTGVNIFFREVQVAWDELHPFADEKTLKAADKLGLGKSAKTLQRYVDRPDFAALVAALVRCDLEKAYDEVRAAARGESKAA